MSCIGLAMILVAGVTVFWFVLFWDVRGERYIAWSIAVPITVVVLGLAVVALITSWVITFGARYRASLFQLHAL